MADKDKKKPVKIKKESKEEIDKSLEEEDVLVEKDVSEKEVIKEEPSKINPEEESQMSDKVDEDEEKKSEEDSSPYFTRSTVYGDSAQVASVEKSFSGKRVLFFLAAIAVSAAIFFAGLMFFNFQFASLGTFGPLSKPTPEPTAAPTLTPTPEPEVNLSELDVQVLNGSGVSGAAAAVAALLEKEGFEDVQVGNAQDQDLENTEVQLKEGVSSEVYSEISSALSDYNVVEGDALDDDSEYDVIVTVGQIKSDEEADEGE